MFCPMDTNEDQLILDGECGNLVAIDIHKLPPCEEIFDRQPPRKVTHGPLGMQLHEERRCDSNENILSRNFLEANCFDRYFRLVASDNHQLGGAKNIFLADEKIEIAILSCTGVSECAQSQGWTLHEEDIQSCVTKLINQSKQLGGHLQRGQRLCALKLANFMRELRWREVFREPSHPRREQRNNAMFFGQGQEYGPRYLAEQRRKYRWIAMGRGALQKSGPFW